MLRACLGSSGYPVPSFIPTKRDYPVDEPSPAVGVYPKVFVVQLN